MKVDWNAWRAYEPSSDFSDRVASAMIGECARWNEARSRSARRARPGRAALALALAACTAAGAGWGLARLAQPRSPAAVVLRDAVPAGAPLDAPDDHWFAPAARAEAEREPASRPASKIGRPASPSSASSQPAPRLVLPRCVCAHAEAICGCLE